MFLLKNKTAEPENSMLAGTNAASPLSNAAFMAFRQRTTGGSEPRLRRGYIDNVFINSSWSSRPASAFRPYSRFLRDGVTAALALQAACH